MIEINLLVNLNLNFQSKFKLLLCILEQQLPGGSAARLPKLSVKYCLGKLNDAKSQIDTSQQLHCCPDCQC